MPEPTPPSAGRAQRRAEQSVRSLATIRRQLIDSDLRVKANRDITEQAFDERNALILLARQLGASRETIAAATGFSVSRVFGIERAAAEKSGSEVPADVVDVRWNENFMALMEYAAEHGNARVPQKYVVDDGRALGAWVAQQRQRYGAGRLSAERVALLESLPKWEWNTVNAQWDESFDALLSYVRETGTAAVPRRYVAPDGFGLGRWVTLQRTRQREGKLEADRVTRLAALPGWSWGREPKKRS